jgi:hypothetical protein
MSDSEKSNAVSFELLVCSDPMALPWPIRRGTDRIYDELNELAELMPSRHRDIFRFRWGLDSHFPHLTTQTAAKFEIPSSTAEGMLTEALWNAARYGHYLELPELRSLLGEDRGRWAERAWQQAETRWGNQESQFSETVLLLAVAGLAVPDAHQTAREHVIKIGLGRGNKWGRARSLRQLTESARVELNRMLEDVIWPSTPLPVTDLSAFSVQRPLPQWARLKTGVFYSDKLARLVQFESLLELHILRQLDLDPRIVGYVEQPMTIAYQLDEETHEYTPDVMVQLDDGRAFVIEAKPREQLGDFTNVLKWSSLSRHCQALGLGFWVGSPQRSLVEHRRLQPDPVKRELVLTEVRDASASGDDYRALVQLVGFEELGLIVTQEHLEWRAGMHVRQAEETGRDAMKWLWALVDKYA